MKVFIGTDDINRNIKNPAITIGNFDGVHLGHKALFQKVKEWARKLDGESVVMTFHPHPLQVLRPANGPAFITLHEQKLALIESCGIDAVVVIPFSIEFAQITATDFVKDLLVGKIGAKAIVVGYDYRFGRNREGDTEFLRKMGEQHGFELEVVSGIQTEGVVVSSTIIRRLICDGRIREAGSLLGRPYEIRGSVVKGRDRGGRLLGFPTANVCMSTQAAPKPGVYAVMVEVDDKQYMGAANLGYNPTFENTDLSLEVYILDFSENIYGKPIMVRFIDRLRDEKRFSGLDELIAQIQKDVEITREILTERQAPVTVCKAVGAAFRD
jgi:riboflavin kinase/FMN adenylyltransferase